MKKLSVKARARLGAVLAALLLLINFGYYKSSKEAAFFGGNLVFDCLAMPLYRAADGIGAVG